MLSSWQALGVIEQILWLLALASSAFFVGMVLSIFDGVADIELAEVSDVLEYLSLRDLAAFTLGFSWTGVLFYDSLGTLSLALAAFVGFGFANLNRLLTQRLQDLETSGNLPLTRAIGQDAKVSVQIDPLRQNPGKIVVSINGREVERLALTDDAEGLARGDTVHVCDVANGMLLVSKDGKLDGRTLQS